MDTTSQQSYRRPPPRSHRLQHRAGVSVGRAATAGAAGGRGWPGWLHTPYAGREGPGAAPGGASIWPRRRRPRARPGGCRARPLRCRGGAGAGRGGRAGAAVQLEGGWGDGCVCARGEGVEGQRAGRWATRHRWPLQVQLLGSAHGTTQGISYPQLSLPHLSYPQLWHPRLPRWMCRWPDPGSRFSASTSSMPATLAMHFTAPAPVCHVTRCHLRTGHLPPPHTACPTHPPSQPPTTLPMHIHRSLQPPLPRPPGASFICPVVVSHKGHRRHR